MTKILAYRISGPCTLSNSLSEVTYTDLSQLFDWLIFSHTTVMPSCLKVVWNLSDLVKLIAKDLPEDVRDQLSHHPHRARWGNYKLFSASDKMFSVGKNGSEATVYDLSQYYPEEDGEPGTLEELQGRADRLAQTLADLGIPNPPSLSSPVAAFKCHPRLVEVLEDVPTIYDALAGHLEAFDVALSASPREWISNYQVGYFPELYSYDLSSAYPFQAAHLIDLRDCELLRIEGDTKANWAAMQNAWYGFLVGDFTVFPNHPLSFCAPFLTDRGDGTLINFVGTKKGYSCYLGEVNKLYRHEMGTFQLRYGWLITPLSGVQPRVPFQNMMGRLYSQRGPDELASYLLKRTMNGIIGKMLESFKDTQGNIIEYGNLYNPIYHAICTASTRLRVFDFIIQNKLTPQELVFVGLDGIKCTRKLPVSKQSVMGYWREAKSESAVVLSPSAIISPSRKFKKTSFEDIMYQLCAHPTASKFGVNGDIDLRKLFLSQSREFDSLPRTGQDLLNCKYISSPPRL